MMSGLQIFVLTIIILCILWFGFNYLILQNFNIADDDENDDGFPEHQMENKSIDADDVIDKNEKLTTEDTTEIKHNYEKHISNNALTVNISDMLNVFVNMELRKAKYDDLLFEYPKIIKRIRDNCVNTGICRGNSKYNKWAEDTFVLKILASDLLKALAVDLYRQKSMVHPAIKLIIDKFISHFNSVYKHQNIPWGRDAMSFIEMTYVLAIYMVSKYPNENERKTIAKIILTIIQKPNYVFNKTLPSINIIYASTPWILANHCLGTKMPENDINKIKTLVLRQYCDVPDNGFHIDKSFSYKETFDFALPNKLCVKYKYELLVSLIDEFKNSTSLTMIKATRELDEIIIHPNIKIGTYNINTFNSNNYKLTSADVLHVPDNNYGIKVMPLAKVIRLFTRTYSFAVRGVNTFTKYTPESVLRRDEQKIPKFEFSMTQIRRVLSLQDTPETIKYPGFGCVFWVNDQMKDNNDLFIRRCTSYVGAYNKIGVFYQTYEVTEMERGSYNVEEFISIINKEQSQIIDINIKITNFSEKYDLIYYGYDDTTVGNVQNIFTIEHSQTKLFKTKLSINYDKLRVVEPTHINTTVKFVYPIIINDNIAIIENDGNVIITKDLKEKKVYCPSVELNIKPNPDYKYNKQSNQWMYNKNSQ